MSDPSDLYENIAEIPDEEAQPLITVVQWDHRHGGGFEIPAASLPPSCQPDPEFFTPVEVQHSGSDEPEAAYLAKKLHLAVLSVRRRLEQKMARPNGGWITVTVAEGNLGENGVYSRTHVLAYCRELDDMVMLTVKSTTSADINKALWALDDFRKSVSWAVQEKLSQGRGGKPRGIKPRWVFYLPLAAGKPTNTGKGGQRVPLLHEVPAKVTQKAVTDLLVPRDMRDTLQEWRAWARENWECDPEFTAAGQFWESTSNGDVRAKAPNSRQADTAKQALQVVSPVGAKGRPEFAGQTLGQILDLPAGKAFIKALAKKRPGRKPDVKLAVRAAQAIVSAGLVA